jgi:hypothetical protein
MPRGLQSRGIAPVSDVRPIEDPRVREARELLSTLWTWGHRLGFGIRNPPCTFTRAEADVILARAAAEGVDPVHAANDAITARNNAMTDAYVKTLN